MVSERFSPLATDYVVVPVQYCTRHGDCLRADLPLHRNVLGVFTVATCVGVALGFIAAAAAAR